MDRNIRCDDKIPDSFCNASRSLTSVSYSDSQCQSNIVFLFYLPVTYTVGGKVHIS